MRSIGVVVIAIGLVLLFSGVADVGAQEPYQIGDAVRGNENIKFTWTKDGNDFLPDWQLMFKCDGDAAFNSMLIAPTVPFDFRNLRPDLVGKACEFKFFAPAAATDWRQEIIGPDGKSTVFSGNIKKDSPWTFAELHLLPGGFVRIPDLAPISPGEPELTIYTAVNLELYMTENRLGFLGEDWSVGDTLADLGVEIMDGEVPGLQGIYWATTPFEFDPDPAGRGFTPVGGDANLLDSASFPHDIEILAQHVGPRGGIVELPVAGSEGAPSAAAGSDSSSPPYGAIGGAAAAAAVAIVAGGWYARRRWMR